jgi:hypothetical protein
MVPVAMRIIGQNRKIAIVIFDTLWLVIHLQLNMQVNNVRAD